MELDSSLSWLALTLTPGIAARLSARLLKEFGSPDSGKVANYIIRWIHRDGSHGSWSEIARATVVG